MFIQSPNTFVWQLFNNILKLGGLDGLPCGSISPVGVWLALLLALNGAGISSVTHQELWAVLNYGQKLKAADTPAAEQQLNNQTHVLVEWLQKQAGKGSSVVLSSGVWARNVVVNRAYIENMWHTLKTPVQSVKSAFPINAWIVKNTNGLIKEAVPQTTAFDLLITTAVYFKGSWAFKFSTAATTQQPFTTAGQNGSAPGKVVQVPMMYRAFRQSDMQGSSGQVMYGEVPGEFRAVKLPYTGSTIVAIAVLPDLDHYKFDIAAAAAGITPDMLFETENWFGLYDIAKLELQLPKFSVKMPHMKLTQALKAMGLNAAFDADSADFSRISNTSLFLNDLLQSALIVVDEEGTQAAAATAAVLTVTAFPQFVPPLTFNRPFLFLLVDDVTKTVLFMTAVTDPSVAETG